MSKAAKDTRLTKRRDGRACWAGIKTAHRRYIALLNRLAEYEDTGMTPEETVERLHDWYSCKSAIEEYKMLGDFGRLSELAKADKEGRVRIVGVPRGACCGNCANFKREAGTAHGACEVEGYAWVTQSRNACTKSYKTILKNGGNRK